MRSPLLVRKRRVSVTRMGAKQSYPSNHGTHPNTYPNRTFARSFPSAMATATASPPPSATQQRYKSSQPSIPPFARPTQPIPTRAAAADNVTETPEEDVIDPDEPWILDLKQEMERELAKKAATLYNELLKTLADAGPFIDHDKANALQANYQKELDEVRQAHQKEVDQLVHMERQYRLWSMGAEDPEWEIWEALREEQLCILKGIQKMAGIDLDEEDPLENDDDYTANDNGADEVGRQVRETAEENEQVNRQFAEWQRTEAQRARDRERWREGMGESQAKIKERRRQDYRDLEARLRAQQGWNDRSEQLASEARQGSAALRGQPSLATLFANGETFVTWKPGPSSTSDTQSRASFADSSWSSDTSFTTSDTTPASSIYFNPLDSPPPRHSNARPVPLHPPDERNRFSSGSGYYSGSGLEERQRTPYGSFSNSNSSRMHGPGHTPSPTPPSNIPNSNPSHGKSSITDPIPERWIPPGHQPREKPSMHFDNKSSKETSGPTRSKSALFGESPAPPHPPIPGEETSKPAATPDMHHSQRPVNNYSSSTLNASTTADHHTNAAPPRTTPYPYSFSSSASASSAGGAASGIPTSVTAAPPTSTSAPASTSRVPSSSYQAPPAPGLRSKPLPQHPPPQTSTPSPGPNSASSSSSSSTTKPSYPSTHTHIPPQRHHSFATQPSPTEPKSFQSQSNRSFSASASSSFSASIPGFSARTSSASASTAVPPASPVDDVAATSRASGSATSSSSMPQSADRTKNATSAAHSATHATQTPFSKASSSQTHAQPPPAQTQSAQTPNPFASTEEFRTKLRHQYVADEERRAEEERLRRLEEESQRKQEQEEERRRKEQEANERRAEEAKKRGEERRRDEERRRQEEMARDAERREQERKARKAAAAAAAAAGMSGSYPGAGFAFGGSYGTTGSTSSSMPGANHGPSSSASGSFSSASASVTSPSTPPPSSSPTVPEIWDAHEKQWAAMAKVPNLRFRSMPWPMLTPISSPEQLIPIRIAQFIFHAQHSQGKSKERRLREALLKWHPDRFDSKWLPKVVPEDREKVADGAGRVVRALNELLNGIHNNGFGE